MKTVCILSFCCALFTAAQAQDIEQITKKGGLKGSLGDPFSVDGGLGISFRSYQAWQIDQRQTPFATTLNANATIQTFTVTIPFSLVIHNLDQVEHPFQKDYWKGFLSNQRNRLTRFGASPYYKWAKAHFGHRYMNFSEFTLANHNFLGAGVELTPGKWRFAAMAGRLAKAEPQSLSLRTPNVQHYTRNGWGAKFGWGDAQDYIEGSVFSGKDDPGSLNFQGDSLFIVTPLENFVLGLKGRKAIYKNVSLEFELAESALTRNAEDPVFDKGFFLYNGFLFERKTSTGFHTAADAKLNYNGKGFQAGLQYRRIDPGYRSLGAYFFNDDLENYTAYTNLTLFNKKLNARLQGGIQRNNLDGSKQAEFKRIIGSANLQYSLDMWSLGANLSNFSSRVDYLLNPELDSLNVVVVSREANVSVNRAFPGEQGASRAIAFMAGVQTVNDNIEIPENSTASTLFFGNFAFSATTASQWSWTASLDFNRNELNSLSMSRYGVGLQSAKSFLENKFNAGAGCNYYFNTVSGGGGRSHLVNTFWRASWQVLKNHSLNLQFNWLANAKTSGSQPASYHELIGSLGYQTQFGYRPFQKEPQKE